SLRRARVRPAGTRRAGRVRGERPGRTDAGWPHGTGPVLRPGPGRGDRRGRAGEALAVAQRVRWQLDGWHPARAGGDGGPADEGTSGITMLRLVPDQLVPDEGRQLGLWGDDLVSGRVERAAVRLQAMLGHESVAHPLLAGGRGPGEQVVLVPFGDMRDTRFPADRPWPARIPPPAPATVYPAPLPARVIDAAGVPVTVTGRAVISAPP